MEPSRAKQAGVAKSASIPPDPPPIPPAPQWRTLSGCESNSAPQETRPQPFNEQKSLKSWAAHLPQQSRRATHLLPDLSDIFGLNVKATFAIYRKM